MGNDLKRSELHRTNSEMLLSVSPLLVLALILAGVISIFGDGTTSGPAQLAMILTAVMAAGIGIYRGHSWDDLETSSTAVIGRAMPIVLIILVIGMLIGVWIVSGVIPAMIYYGLNAISPDIFYLATFMICSLVAVCVGSSWTTAGTVGLALVSIADLSGLSPSIAAGAVISGGYFGDKLSPLSDTTNLAAGITYTALFDHIKNLLWTTIPAVLIAVIGFYIFSIGGSDKIDMASLERISSAIYAQYQISLLLFIPLVVTFTLAAYRAPAFISLLSGSIVAAIIGLMTQTDLLSGGWTKAIEILINASTTGYVSNTGNIDLDNLLSRGGMASMLNTVWLIISAMFFGGMMEKSGCLKDIVNLILSGAKTGAALMQRAGLTSLVSNIITPDQFLSISVPGQMYREKFKEAGLESKNLSRVLEDFGTVVSPLVPWNTCGAYMAATLGVATIAYLPYCLFNLANPIISLILINLNIQVHSVKSKLTTSVGDKSDPPIPVF